MEEEPIGPFRECEIKIELTACFPPQSFAIVVRLGDPGLVGRVPGRGIRKDGTVPAVVGAGPLAKLGAYVHSRAELVGALGTCVDQRVASSLVIRGLLLCVHSIRHGLTNKN